MRRARLHDLWQELQQLNLATPNIGLLTNWT
ncbi:sulfite reductase [Bordetella pertussis]|nr:sulfite reductase [Bordetella pertussis]